MRHVVTTGTAQPRPIAAISATTSWPEFPALWRQLLDEVHATVRWEGGARPGRNVMLYHDGVPNVEIGVELDKPAVLGGRVVRSQLPAGTVAMTTHRGGYDELGAAHDAVLAWCAEQGLTVAGPRWEVYGHWTGDPAAAETDIFWLLA